MEKLVFVTQFSFSPLSITKEKNNGLRLTVEGQSYTCRELVEKHKVGQMPPVQNNQLKYSGDVVIQNFADITEYEEVKRMAILRDADARDRATKSPPEASPDVSTTQATE